MEKPKAEVAQEKPKASVGWVQPLNSLGLEDWSCMSCTMSFQLIDDVGKLEGLFLFSSLASWLLWLL